MTELLTLQGYTQEIEGMLERSAYDEAIAHSQHILQKHPKYVEPYRLIGQAAFDREDYQQATDMFTRILSAKPSDFVSRAGLAVVYDKQGSLKDALWQMERAYELEPGNAAVQEELRKLYARRDGVPPDKVPLTRGALARLYMNGELYSEAVAELRALLAVEPDRVDLQALLAEALWRDEQRLEASEVALKVLDRMPYCLDANLILGEIWMNGGREEDAEVHLKRALALDPEGRRAAQLFGKSSPIPSSPVEVERLDFVAPTAAPVSEEAPAWLSGIGAAAEAGAPAEEIPAWLEGIGLAALGEAVTEELAPGMEAGAPPQAEIEEEIPSWLSGFAAAPQAPAPPIPQVEEEAPEWLEQLRAAPPTEEAPAAPVEAGIPDWLQILTPEGAEQPAPAVEAEAEAAPDWLAQLGEAAPAVPTEEVIAAPEAAEIPDWLKALKPEGAEQLAAEVAEEEPEWLAQLHAQAGVLPGLEEEAVPEAAVAAPEAAEIPDWLRAPKPEGVEEAAPAAEVPEWLMAVPEEAAEAPPVEVAPPAPEAEAPAWMAEGAAMPSPEEAMAFFQKLTAGKEAELQTQAQAEAEARMAEITGKPAPAPIVAPPPTKVEAPPPPTVEAPTPVAEEAPMLSPEEAMAFFQKLAAGKEAELQAQAQAEAEARMAEIMGKPAPAPAPEAVMPPPALVVTPPAKVEAPPPPEVEAPALVAEGAPMPSPEEAMAFFQRLAAGKEAELQAQARAEAEARMAEITGRKPTPAPEAVTAPPAPVVPPSAKVEAPPPPEVEAPAPVAPLAVEQVQPPQPVVEQPPMEAVEEVPVMPIPASLEEWWAPPQAVEPVQEIPEGWEALVQPPPIEAWPKEAAAPAVMPEAAVLSGLPEEVMPPVAEQVPAAAVRQPIAGTAGPEWWYQTLEDEEGPAEEVSAAAPLAEAAPAAGAIPFTEVMPITPVAPVAVPPKPVPAAPPAPARAARAPKRLVRTKPTPAAPPKPTVDMDAIIARLHTNPDDHQALLDLARGWRQMDDMNAARNGYDELVRRNVALNDVISDLESIIEDRPDDVDSIRLLGDAHMKAGNLQKALKLYRQALKRL
jgi:tetratricopeptide (TPR) repeat protein